MGWDLPWSDYPETLVENIRQSQLASAEIPLATKPRVQQWHVSKPSEKGTLEITWDPDAMSYWMSCRANRQGDWIEEQAEALVDQLICF